MQNILDKILPPAKTDPPYAWMLRETPQHEWIDSQGVLLWLAFFFSEIGAGAYFMSLFYDFRPGYIVGYVTTFVLGGLIHMAYLGNPLKTIGMFSKVKNSELSRGMWVLLLLAVLGFFQAILGVHFNVYSRVAMGVICAMIVMHGFATMNVVKAIPSWNQSTVLPLSLVSGIWVGSQIVQFAMGASGLEIVGLEVWSRAILLAYIVLTGLYIWGSLHGSEAAKFSVQNLIQGDYSKLFLVGVVGIGFGAPLLITLLMWKVGVFSVAVLIRFALVFTGDLALRYSLMKSAYYPPLL